MQGHSKEPARGISPAERVDFVKISLNIRPEEPAGLVMSQHTCSFNLSQTTLFYVISLEVPLCMFYELAREKDVCNKLHVIEVSGIISLKESKM